MLRSALIISLVTALGCSSDVGDAGQRGSASASARAAALPTISPSADLPSARDMRAVGQGLVAKHECNRCHDGSGIAAAPTEKHCVSCHLDIAEDRFKASPAVLAEWKPHVTHLRYAPSLSAVGSFVKPAWVTRYLLEPRDLRPYLHANMPRLQLDQSDAEAIAAFFASRESAAPAKSSLAGDLERGRGLFTTKTCATCHQYSGAGTPSPSAVSASAATQDRTLAPDLRFARERLVFDRLAPYIADPKSVKPDAAMPKLAMSEQEAADLAKFVFEAPLSAPPEPIKPPRLPLLARPVGYDEVAEKILHKICWHCHSQPDYARGDGGPGNTGGFGFAPRKLDLASYESISSGYLDAQGERRSLFTPGPAGEPVLLEVLLARQKEERGGHAEVRGMPLGLPSVSPEIIQLIETWIAAGHPR